MPSKMRLLNRWVSWELPLFHVRKEGRARGREKALVPGFGRGVNVFLLARFGYYVYGLEYGAAAVMCHQEAAKVGNDIPVRND